MKDPTFPSFGFFGIVEANSVVFHLSKTPANSSDREVLLNVVNNATLKLDDNNYVLMYTRRGSSKNYQNAPRLVTVCCISEMFRKYNYAINYQF